MICYYSEWEGKKKKDIDLGEGKVKGKNKQVFFDSWANAWEELSFIFTITDYTDLLRP